MAVSETAKISVKSRKTGKVVKSADQVSDAFANAQKDEQASGFKSKLVAVKNSAFVAKVGSAFAKFGGFVKEKASNFGHDFSIGYAAFKEAQTARREESNISKYTEFLESHGYSVAKSEQTAEPVKAESKEKPAEAVAVAVEPVAEEAAAKTPRADRRGSIAKCVEELNSGRDNGIVSCVYDVMNACLEYAQKSKTDGASPKDLDEITKTMMRQSKFLYDVRKEYNNSIQVQDMEPAATQSDGMSL